MFLIRPKAFKRDLAIGGDGDGARCEAAVDCSTPMEKGQRLEETLEDVESHLRFQRPARQPLR